MYNNDTFVGKLVIFALRDTTTTNSIPTFCQTLPKKKHYLLLGHPTFLTRLKTTLSIRIQYKEEAAHGTENSNKFDEKT